MELPTDTVYHYTSAAAGIAILQNSEIWLSDLRCSNDRSEFIHRREDIQREVLAKTSVSIEGSEVPESYYGVCFTELEDALSQWRGYGNNNGVTLGVDLETLPDGARTLARWQFLSMRYGDEGFEEAVEKITQEIASRATKSATSPYEGFFSNRRVAMHVSSLKHEGFREEREWRLLLSHPWRHAGGSAWPPVRYRTATDGLVIPYMALPICLSAVRSIWIGPGRHQAVHREIVNQLVNDLYRGLSSRPDIYESRTPYE